MQRERERERERESRAFGDALCSHLHFRGVYLYATCRLHEWNRVFVSWPKIHT